MKFIKISIRINANDYSIKSFIEIDDKGKINISSEVGMVSVNKTLEDAIIYVLTRQKLMSSSIITKSNTDNYNEIQELQSQSKLDLKNNLLLKNFYLNF